MPKRTAEELAEELTTTGPQGMTKHDLGIARRYLRRQPKREAYEKRLADAKALAASQTEEAKRARARLIDSLVLALSDDDGKRAAREALENAKRRSGALDSQR